jgi:hypothetical protein
MTLSIQLFAFANLFIIKLGVFCLNSNCLLYVLVAVYTHADLHIQC